MNNKLDSASYTHLIYQIDKNRLKDMEGSCTSIEFMKCLNEDVQEKKNRSCSRSPGSNIKIATST